MAQDTLGDGSATVCRHSTPDHVSTKCIVNIGATGAPTVLTGRTEWTFTRTGIGTYTGTMPKSRSQATSGTTLRGWVQLSAAKTVGNVIFTAVDFTAGTFGFTTAITAGTAADPANGDQLAFLLDGGIAGYA